MLTRWFFDWMYRFSRPPWDSGITPPEVMSEIESGKLKAGRALDLGCGTGTNSVYLARHGFHVVGVDFSAKAIDLAKKRALQAGANIEFNVADVTRLDFLREPFDFVLDIGCMHGLSAPERARYAGNLVRLTRPGALYMLYAFAPRSMGWRKMGLDEHQVQALFTPSFTLERVDRGTDRGLGSAWYWFRRPAVAAH